MIAIIGVMIGFYILARALEMFCKQYRNSGSYAFMCILSVGLIFVTLICMALMVMSGTTTQ